jgi:hypothetical protein
MIQKKPKPFSYRLPDVKNEPKLSDVYLEYRANIMNHCGWFTQTDLMNMSLPRYMLRINSLPEQLGILATIEEKVDVIDLRRS